jgi:hypothetical protein
MKQFKELRENRALFKDYEQLKKKGKSDSQCQDILLSMPKYKRYDSAKLGKLIGDGLRKGTISKKAPFKIAEDSIEEKAIHNVKGKDGKTYSIELDQNGRKIMVRTKNNFGDIATIPLKKATKIFERKDAAADLYFDTYSAAIQHAIKSAEKKGFKVDEDDLHKQVTIGQGKPKRGKTTRHNLKLTKNGKPVRKGLSIQVYNRETPKKPYELNFYVS